MASGYPVPFEGQGEVKEGFLCPLCLKDLQSFYQLQEHYETEHRGEDGHVKGQLKSLVQKAKKAKDKLLKRDGDERADAGAYESFYCGGVDPYMWEPQELGATRSHLDDFKKYRAARIDHYVIEVNKLIIRLEKLTSFDRTNADAAKIRAIEKSVVSWVSDSDVPLCPDCGNRFNLRNRRHHCRLCGSIMCKRCMEFVPLPMAYKLTSGTQEALCGSPGQTQSRSPPPGGSAQGSRRGSISSLSSVSSVLEEKDDERIRCCHHCMDTLLKRQEKLEEKGHVPDVVKLYERLRLCMDKVDQKAPEYIQMAESLNSGETTYNLDHANDLRMEVQKYYELIDALSKKILSLGMTEEPPPHPKSLQLQRMVRYSATLFVQEKLLGLMSLPTKDKYEELKIKRKQELEKKMQQERLAALEAQKKRSELEKARPVSSHNGESTGGESTKPVMTKSGGWLPASSTLHTRAIEDPLLQQIDNIQSFIKQARAAQRFDEVATLEENLRQLQDEYDQQQTSLAIELSRKTAEEESLQQQQQEEEGISKRSLDRNSSLDIWDARGTRALEDQLDDGEGNWGTARTKSSPPSRSQSTKTYRRLPSQEHAPPQQLKRQENPPVQAVVQVPNPAALSNPFEDEDSSPLAEDPSNPFAEEILKEKSQKGMVNGKKPYNPFDEEEEQPAPNPGEFPGGLNPFEDEDDEHNPFSEPSKGTTPAVRPGASTNPFDADDAPDKDAIDEELLLQQIDNIRAYIFDAKLSGRVDEVELLSENLWELQHTLQEQRRKTH